MIVSRDSFGLMGLFGTSYLATRGDADVLVRGYKLLLRVAKADVYKNWWVPGELDESFLETKTDEELEKIVRSRCTTLCVYIIFHSGNNLIWYWAGTIRCALQGLLL